MMERETERKERNSSRGDMTQGRKESQSKSTSEGK